jgi:hypothetical protein
MVVPFVRGGRADVGAATIRCAACGALALRQQAGNDASSAQPTSAPRAPAAQRIVEATIALHEGVGPARTTISDVARRAGVGRLTVYRHFPDEPMLLSACSSL